MPGARHDLVGWWPGGKEPTPVPGRCPAQGPYEGDEVRTPEGNDEERALDLSAELDALLGFTPTDSYILIVVDPSAGGLQAYGPIAGAAIHDAAAAMRRRLREDGVHGVSVNVLPLYSPED